MRWRGEVKRRDEEVRWCEWWDGEGRLRGYIITPSVIITNNAIRYKIL